jgi:hypothetical protein
MQSSEPEPLIFVTHIALQVTIFVGLICHVIVLRLYVFLKVKSGKVRKLSLVSRQRLYPASGIPHVASCKYLWFAL